MDKKQKILLVIIGILVIVAIVIGFLAFKKEKNDSENVKINKFKEEYEIINGTTDKEGFTYPTVEIDLDSSVEYIDIKKANKIIDNENAVIYIGNAQDFLSRDAIVPLLNAIESNGISTLYYLDSSYTKDNSSEEYLKLLSNMESILNKDELEDDNGNKVGTIKKEIYVPTVIVVSNGNIIDYHIGTIDTHMKDDDLKRELTKEEQEKLFDIYVNMLLKISDSSCNEVSKC